MWHYVTQYTVCICLYISYYIYLLLISNFHMFRHQAGPPSDHLTLHTAYAGKPCRHGGHAVGEWCLEDVVLHCFTVKVKWDDARRNCVRIWNFRKVILECLMIFQLPHESCLKQTMVDQLILHSKISLDLSRFTFLIFSIFVTFCNIL